MGLHLLAEPYAPGPQDEVRGGVDDPDHRPQEQPREVQRAADPERDLLGLLDGEVLGRLLPEDEVRVGYYPEPEGDRDYGNHPVTSHPKVRKHGLYEVRDGGLADP